MTILTKGDPVVQEKKIAAINQWLKSECDMDYRGVFGETEIVETTKTAEKFLEMAQSAKQGLLPVAISGAKNPVTVYAVGNDYDKDIAPALSVGFRGVWIPVETWETMGQTEKIKERMDKEHCRVFNSLTEIVERYAEL